ncbi:hypothetical protein [Streptomyces sp. NBC_01243]|uniref:hypothetical protein n=1 Tax=Streptomyces sp. NBC_01243 TaxID=2903796 RepID=UPI003DA482A2
MSIVDGVANEGGDLVQTLLGQSCGGSGDADGGARPVAFPDWDCGAGDVGMEGARIQRVAVASSSPFWLTGRLR